MIALARLRVPSGKVTFLAADVLDWAPPRRFDTVFFAFWLSHVPASAFGRFWSVVRSALASDGRDHRDLTRQLGQLGWQAAVGRSGQDWLLGEARPIPEGPSALAG